MVLRATASREDKLLINLDNRPGGGLKPDPSQGLGGEDHLSAGFARFQAKRTRTCLFIVPPSSQRVQSHDVTLDVLGLSAAP